MKPLVVLAALLATHAGNALPLESNSITQYEENNSRYIWMSDDEGVSHLVDLEEPVAPELLMTKNGASNEYWLYTRVNPSSRQIIEFGNANSISNSNYAPNKPLKVIMHGWTGSGNSRINTLITAAFLAASDVNVIVVDWRDTAAGSYLTAARSAPNAGRFVGYFVTWLINTAGGDWDNVHFVGYSLGAHALGNAGRATGGKARRVTGLDPAGPLWYAHLRADALGVDAGQYVEVIHTDIVYMGIAIEIGHTDFYPNGGFKQPGCDDNHCSHRRSFEFFASSVRTDHLVGRQCTGLAQAVVNQCTGSTLNMGNGILTKQGLKRVAAGTHRILEASILALGSSNAILIDFKQNNARGIYGLTTGSYWPF